VFTAQYGPNASLIQCNFHLWRATTPHPRRSTHVCNQHSSAVNVNYAKPPLFILFDFSDGSKFGLLTRKGVSRDSSVGMATRYGLNGRGIEPGRGRDFPHQFRPVRGPSLQSVQGLFPRGQDVCFLSVEHVAQCWSPHHDPYGDWC